MKVQVADGSGGLTLTVTDAGPAAEHSGDDVSDMLVHADGGADVTDPAVALAVLTGLVDDVQVEHGPGGTTVTMHWPLPVGASGPGATLLSTP